MKIIRDIFIALAILFVTAIFWNILDNNEIFRKFAYGDQVCWHITEPTGLNSLCDYYDDFELNGVHYHPGSRTTIVTIFLGLSYLLLVICLFMKIVKRNNIKLD